MYRVLICDDERDIVNALKIYLYDANYTLYTAYDGAEALQVICENEIHLILMDIMMPQMDGISAMIKIREISNVPVILLTAKGDKSDVVLGLGLGSDDYVKKPFDGDELLARIAAALRRAASVRISSQTVRKSSARLSL